LLVLGFVPLALTIVRPVERITAAARALGAGDLRARVGLKRRDELGRLGQVFDDMAARLEQLVRSERALLANVSHELRTPLSRIRVVLELAGDGEVEAEAEGVRRYLAEIAVDLAELERIVEDVLASARLDGTAGAAGSPPLRWARVAPRQLVDEIKARFAGRHPDRVLQVTEGELSAELELDAMMVRRAVENVLDNAVKYSPTDRPVLFRIVPVKGGICATVEDFGVGMDPSDTSQLFTPFFRADSSRARASGGIGLGLVLARSIARAHGGDARVESVAGVGTVVRLTFFGRGAHPEPSVS
jgi:signal transduction histidine kinase